MRRLCITSNRTGEGGSLSCPVFYVIGNGVFTALVLWLCVFPCVGKAVRNVVLLLLAERVYKLSEIQLQPCRVGDIDDTVAVGVGEDA